MRLERRHGFALPSVLIASVVMLSVLAIAISSVSAVRVAIKEQHYEQLAKVAGEAGAEYARACLAKNNNIPLWTDDKPLTPATDCSGNSILTASIDLLVVAGGGGGGQGGGGGGGVIEVKELNLTSTGEEYITVGAGGGRSNDGSVAASQGGNSSAFGYTAIGGGRGGTPSYAAGSGGSGGGSSVMNFVNADGTDGQGNSGGVSILGSGTIAGSAGGGGASGSANIGIGGITTGSYGGNGGAGRFSDVGINPMYYGGGGGGGVALDGSGTSVSPVDPSGEVQSGLGGIGGGGRGFNSNGSANLATNGSPNTGGGGGGNGGGLGGGGNGGDGVVWVRYSTDSGIQADGGAVSEKNGYKYHKFEWGDSLYINSLGDSSCPADDRCFVYKTSDIATSFSVKKPVVDSSGRAVSIPQSGYVNLLRKSNGAVWRTYSQSVTRSAAVPEVCSNISSASGWGQATRSSRAINLAGAPSAVPITGNAGDTFGRHSYFQKDFSVNTAGDYELRVSAPSSYDKVKVWVDDVLRATVSGSAQSVTINNLTAGCHKINVHLEGQALVSTDKRFALAILDSDNNPIVVSDTTWRARPGNNISLTCPTGYVRVPGNFKYGTEDFCVMKYEAKRFNGSTQVVDGSGAYVATHTVSSVATGTPWTNLTQPQAVNRSSALGSRYRLISDPEWMTIATDLVGNPSNWSGGSVGSGYMYRGHGDSSPASTIAASTDDSDGYANTGNTAGQTLITGGVPGNSQKRTLVLSNGDVIWDIAGNAMEWTNATVSGSGSQPGSLTQANAFGWTEYNDPMLRWNNFPVTSRPLHLSYGRINGVGGLWTNPHYTAQRMFLRGGFWGDSTGTGVFTLGLSYAPDAANVRVGFRVTYN